MFETQIAHITAKPPRPVSELPGLRLRSVISRSGLALPLAVLLLFGLMPAVVFLSNPNGRLAFGATQMTTGTIVGVTELGCRGNGHRVIYTFHVTKGLAYRGATSLTPDSPDYRLGKGDHMAVRYLVSDPTTNTIPGVRDNADPPLGLFFVFPLLAALLTAPMWLPQMRALWRARHVFRTGVLVTGSVLFVKRRAGSVSWPGWPTSPVSDVTVAYPLPSGGMAEATAWCNNEWLLHQLPLGAAVHIAVLPGKPDQAVLLEAFVR